MTDKEAKRGPAAKFKRGSIEAAIFENHKDSKTWHNVSIYRRYKNSSGEYRETSTYSLADLVQVVKVTEQAEAWITERLNELGTAPTSNAEEII